MAEVNTPKKTRTVVAKKTLDGSVVGFNFTDGRNLSLDVNTLSQEMRNRLATHGASQKIGDTYAGAESVAEAYLSASAMIEQLKSGKWAGERTGGGGINVGLVLRAIARFRSIPVEEAGQRWAKLTPEQQAGVAKSEPILAAIAAIRAEEAAAKPSTVDVESLI